MIENIKKITNEDSGAVQIVEATFVFPIMFIVLFFLIYMGNAFYFKAQIESVVARKAVEGARCCADPLLEYIQKNNGAVPSLDDLDVEPYRYIFGGMDDVESKIGREVKEEITSSKFSFFKNMKPKLKTGQSDIAKFNNYVIYSTFSVDVSCDVQFPIRFLGEATPYVLRLNSHSEVAVNDATEFIRNTDMAIDYFGDTKVGKTVKGAFDKINEFLSNFAGW